MVGSMAVGWTLQEDELLKRLIATHGKNWKLMLGSFPGRSVASLKHRFWRMNKGASVRRWRASATKMRHPARSSPAARPPASKKQKFLVFKGRGDLDKFKLPPPAVQPVASKSTPSLLVRAKPVAHAPVAPAPAPVADTPNALALALELALAPVMPAPAAPAVATAAPDVQLAEQLERIDVAEFWDFILKRDELLSNITEMTEKDLDDLSVLFCDEILYASCSWARQRRRRRGARGAYGRCAADARPMCGQ